jgi:hypothetical protein
MGEKKDSPSVDVKDSVMKRIKEKQVKMKCASFFLAEKMGLQGALIASLVVGALIISITFHFLDKTKLFRFSSLGFPGLRVIFLTIPYDYLVLFFLVLILAIYFAKKLDIPCRENITFERIFVYFFLASFLVGLFFITLGMHKFVKGWSTNKIPRHMSIHGKIVEVTSEEVFVEDDDGRLTELIFDKKDLSPSKKDYIQGMFLRAVGNRDKNNETFFHVEGVLCCDED